jgi:catalase-peroxidase
LVSPSEVKELKKEILNSELSISELVSTAWASASTYRHSDRRGGANGSRIRLAPQKNWEVNNPEQLKKVLTSLSQIQTIFNKRHSSARISLADLIVLAGNTAVEKAALNAGQKLEIVFTPGRMDAKEDQTDIKSFELLEPMADGFRNYLKTEYTIATEELLIDKAQLLRLTAPEMTVLLGGMRSLGTNFDGSKHGVFTDNKNQLTNEFFVNLLTMDLEWKSLDDTKELFEATSTGDEIKYTATRADLIFGSNSELRSLAEVYASNDANKKFVSDFGNAWAKVMNLDRFDLIYK